MFKCGHIQNTSITPDRAERFDILNAFLRHHIQESYTLKNCPFLAHPVHAYEHFTSPRKSAYFTRFYSVPVFCIPGTSLVVQWRRFLLEIGGAEGASVERRKREDRGAEGAGCGEEVSPPHWGWA